MLFVEMLSFVRRFFTDEVAARNSSDVGKKTGLYIRPRMLVRVSRQPSRECHVEHSLDTALFVCMGANSLGFCISPGT